MKRGFTMEDFKNHVVSLKASWMNRFLVNGKLATWKLKPLKYLNVSDIILSIFNMKFSYIKP